MLHRTAGVVVLSAVVLISGLGGLRPLGPTPGPFGPSGLTGSRAPRGPPPGILPAAPTNGTTPVWTHIYPGGHPTPPAGASMAYDPAAHALVLFGGRIGKFAWPLKTSDETWEFANSSWTQVAPPSASTPGQREGAAMAYDAATGQIVVVGGQDRQAWNVGTTWVFAHGNWTLLSEPLGHPGNVACASMAYLPKLHGVVLFGGLVTGAAGATHVRSDTWLFANGTWSKLAPAHSPPPTLQATMVYDPTLHGDLLTGGIAASANETWLFNGTTWVQLHTATPAPAVYGAAATFDTALNAVVVYGGYGSPRTGNETWLFNGTNWINATTGLNPLYRAEASLAYYPPTGVAILFGGGGCGLPAPQRCASTWALH
jgi:phage baseplate assembly protein gpV